MKLFSEICTSLLITIFTLIPLLSQAQTTESVLGDVGGKDVSINNKIITVNEPKASTNSNYKIEQFKELQTDISARTNQVLDADGVPCALLKVNVIAKEFDVRKDNNILNTKKGGINEYCIYLSEMTNEISLIIDGTEVNILCSDFISAGLESKKTYQIIIDNKSSNIVTVKSDINWKKKDQDFYEGLIIMMQIDDILGCRSFRDEYDALSSNKKKEVIRLLETASEKGISTASFWLFYYFKESHYWSLEKDQDKELVNLIRWKYLNQLKTPYPYSIACYCDSPINCPELEQAIYNYNKLKSYFRGNVNDEDFYNSTNFGLNASFLSSIDIGILYTHNYSEDGTHNLSRWYAGTTVVEYIFLALEQKWFEIIDVCRSLHDNNPTMQINFSKASTREYLNYFVDYLKMGFSFSMRDNR